MNRLNNYQIKLLAAVLMVVDHVGAVFFPDLIGFRIIGRFSFPLFIWLLVQGERYTRNFGQYCLRLLLLAIISQPIYYALFHPLWWAGTVQWNILFTLLLGLIALRLARVFPRWQVLIWPLAGAIAQILNLEYGFYGIAAIALVRSFQANLRWWLVWLGLHLVLFGVFPDWAGFQGPAIASPLLFPLANHQPGGRARWFYGFYPAHLLILWGL